MKTCYQKEVSIIALDLCAAPGGKTTDISSRMELGDLLVANEVISTRNAILFENVCKWGLANTVITKADAQKFGEKGPLFCCVRMPLSGNLDLHFNRGAIAPPPPTFEFPEFASQIMYNDLIFRIVFHIFKWIPPPR